MTRQVVDLHPYVGQQIAIDWVREQYGLDPNRIPSDSTFIVDTGARTVTYEEFEFDDAGKHVLVEGQDQVRRVTLVKHFDEPIPEWP